MDRRGTSPLPAGARAARQGLEEDRLPHQVEDRRPDPHPCAEVLPEACQGPPERRGGGDHHGRTGTWRRPRWRARSPRHGRTRGRRFQAPPPVQRHQAPGHLQRRRQRSEGGQEETEEGARRACCPQHGPHFGQHVAELESAPAARAAGPGPGTLRCQPPPGSGNPPHGVRGSCGGRSVQHSQRREHHHSPRHHLHLGPGGNPLPLPHPHGGSYRLRPGSGCLLGPSRSSPGQRRRSKGWCQSHQGPWSGFHIVLGPHPWRRH
mmetsp:Transcript_17991/g.42522  ORF Transcript_17991/g.42522 Transcript_17991/m.42522 type:complete len:263 (-) Transcript_17991:394-1182(-)